jgi:hypothetical protein
LLHHSAEQVFGDDSSNEGRVFLYGRVVFLKRGREVMAAARDDKTLGEDRKSGPPEVRAEGGAPNVDAPG